VPGRHIALAFTVAALWGVNFVAIDVGLRDFPPLLFVALRYAFVAFPAILFVPRPGVSWRYVMAIGLALSAATQGLLFVSIHAGMPAGLASLVVQVQVVFTVALAVVALGERPGARQLVGAAIAFGGIALIAAARGGQHIPAGALALCVGAAGAWGVGNVLTRKAKAPNAFALLVWSSLVPPLPLVALSLAGEGPRRVGHALASAGAGQIAALAYVVVAATAFGFGSWAWLLRRHPASKVAPFALLVPPFGVGSAWIALGERPGLLEAAGGVVVMAGLGLVTLALRLPARRAVPVPAATDACTR
jgi:O-acetylserine/cysteine efflux transporter